MNAAPSQAGPFHRSGDAVASPETRQRFRRDRTTRETKHKGEDGEQDSPHALQMLFPASSRLQSGVVLVPQLWQLSELIGIRVRRPPDAVTAAPCAGGEGGDAGVGDLLRVCGGLFTSTGWGVAAACAAARWACA